MELLNKIPSNIDLVASFVLITTAIVILFLGEFTCAILSLILGVMGLVPWTFFGLFEGT